MTVLIAYASKHGATRDIAERIAAALRQHGQETDVRPVDTVRDAGQYEAAVLGSAVYYGQWLAPATSFVRENQAALAALPVWLFSSGPLGDQPSIDPTDLVRLREALPGSQHRTFAGALDRDHLGLAERVVAKVVHAPVGDFRDWAEIDAWSQDIVSQLALGH